MPHRGPGGQRADIALGRQRDEEQDRLEHLAIDGDESEQEQEPGGAAGERRAKLVADVALPFAGLRLAVHPHADEQQDQCREQRAEALGQLAAGAADGQEMGRRPPGAEAGDERRDPAVVHRAHHLGPVGLAQECQHGDDDQQRLEPFAEQDGEGAEKGRGGAGFARREDALGVGEQGIERGDALADLGDRAAAADCRAELRPSRLRRGPSARRRATRGSARSARNRRGKRRAPVTWRDRGRRLRRRRGSGRGGRGQRRACRLRPVLATTAGSPRK